MFVSERSGEVADRLVVRPGCGELARANLKEVADRGAPDEFSRTKIALTVISLILILQLLGLGGVLLRGRGRCRQHERECGCRIQDNQ